MDKKVIDELRQADPNAKMLVAGHFCPTGCHFYLEVMTMDGSKHLGVGDVVLELNRVAAELLDEKLSGAHSQPWEQGTIGAETPPEVPPPGAGGTYLGEGA